MFFQKANYFEPENYEEQYNNELCKIENQAIKHLIDIHIDSNIIITDVGCGTGLGRSLIPNRYVGLDIAKKPILYSKCTYPGTFHHVDAADYIKSIDSINPIFLFSMDYLEIDTIHEYIKKTDEIFFSVHYNKPYLSTTSVYRGKKDLFNDLFTKQYLQDVRDLFKEYQGNTFSLMGCPFYDVTIIKKG